MKKPDELLKSVLSTKKNPRIKLLGDSITHGFGGTGFKMNEVPFIGKFGRNDNGYCWANRFKHFLEEKYGCTVVNNGCNGTKIEYVIENFDALVDKEDDFILCTIGTNNRHVYINTGYKPSREELGEAFYRNVEKLYELLTATGKEFVLVANIPAAQFKEESGEKFWRILHMDDINAIYKKAAEKYGFAFISMYDLFTEYCKTNQITVDSLLGDGLHPNDQGYDVMYDLLLSEFKLNEA